MSLAFQNVLFGTPHAGFCRFQEEERRRLSRGDNFLQQLRRSGVSLVRGEKVAAVRTEKLDTHRTTTIPSLLAYGGEGNKTSITTIMYYNTYQFFPYSFINIK